MIWEFIMDIVGDSYRETLNHSGYLMDNWNFQGLASLVIKWQFIRFMAYSLDDATQVIMV